ncbi:MAG: glutamine synthetase family protein [Myxococcota bacterium]|nr:glutamine synthetase family protein [Myxococcota bacterium]
MSRPPGALDLKGLTEDVEAGRIDTVVTALPDLYGRLVGKRITGAFFLDQVARHGMHVCDYLLACDMEMDPTPGYAFASWDQGYGDLHAVPDLATLRRVTWHDRTALVLCDAHDGEGRPVPVAPRSVLRRQLERARALGFEPRIGSELEFFLLADSYAQARAKGFRDLATTQGYIEDYHLLSGSFAEPVIGAIRRHMDASAVPVEFSKGEWGPGQHEINLRFAPALEMADRHVVYKLGAKEIAARAGMGLTFMAKWREDLAGSSLHVHASLWTPGGEAAFAAPGAPLAGTPVEAPALFRHWLGGILAHARELCFLFAPTVNAYKRFLPGTFAPTGIAWSWDNRTAGLRVVGRGEALRVECRIPGADANPYLAFAALIAAGLDGVERELDPGPAFEGDVYAAHGLPQVPASLGEALDLLEGSDFARRTFGEDVVAHWLHFGRTEEAAFRAAVTDWERARYLERI